MSIPKFNNVPNKLIITEDGREVFEARDATVCIPVIAFDKNNDIYILLSRRGIGTPNYQHHINLVCGYLDYNESLDDAARRELWEEVGLNVQDIPKENILYNIQEMPWELKSKPDHSKQNVTARFGLVLKYDKVEDFPVLSIEYCEKDEVTEARWYTHEEALTLVSSEEDCDPLVVDKWAFNHYELYRRWVEKVKSFNFN